MKLLLAVTALILASAAPGSGCGWTGLILAPPDVEVHGQNVLLESPLRVVRVEEDSPAEAAGMVAGMEILSLDRERWDEGAFLGNLVRLQTVQPGDTLRIVARDTGDEEHTFKLDAQPCSESQARRRARTLANLGSMEGMIYGRQQALRSLDEERYPEAREMYERVLRDHAAARETALYRLKEPALQLRIADSMRVAEEAMRQAQEALESQEWRREMEESMSQVREAMENVDTRRLMEESLRQARDSEESARLALEAARRLVQGDKGASFLRALEDAQRATQSEEWRRQLMESLARAQEEMGDADLQGQLYDAMNSVRDSEFAARRLLQQLQTALPDEAARRQLEHAMELAGEALQGQEWRRQLEESLRRAQDSLQLTRAQEMESSLVLEQMRRVLEPVRGRDLRRLALLRASEATQRIRRAGALLRGASFQRVEPGISRHVGVDRGLLVLSLEDDSPLAEAGLEAGDVILSVDGKPVDDGGDLFEIVGDHLEALDEDDRTPDSVELEIHQPCGRRTIRLPLTVAGDSPVL